MNIKDYSSILYNAYEHGDYDPDDLNSIEEFLSLDPSERQGYPDRMKEEMEDEDEE